MNLYLESSAALRDLLEGDRYGEIRRLLVDAEVGRVFARLRVLEPRAAAAAAAREARFQSDTELWVVQPVDEAIWLRCSRPFPVEPLRTLDAIHLATEEPRVP